MSLKHDSFKKIRKEKNKWRLDTPEDFIEMEETFLKERLMSKEPTITTTVRITGGKARNFTLEVPKATRPMTDRMKVRVFDILREDIVNKDILDLYAGAGSFGLEALSRGAKSATFVDASKNANIVLKKNVAHTGFLVESEIVKEKVEDYLFRMTNKDKDEFQTFDIIFMDPPYKLFNTKKTFKMQQIINMASELLPGVQDQKTKKWKGAFILKHPKRYDLEKIDIKHLRLVESINFGLNVISFFIVK
ncbi:MAG TPA: RsmD family RNA methyltransferase [Candidatus Dojkabacteria bacterium]|nr:RsmD family RNA methyltransferase [Candidatus Dojkabacteria bacterium]